jgi:LPXTG-site transpeptidase (sortase) family protein
MEGETEQTRMERLHTGAAARRRHRMRVAGNVLIAASLLGLLAIVFYFVGTCAYTGRQQDRLRDELATDNPGLAEAAGSFSESDFIPVAAWVGAAAAEAERRAQLRDLESSAQAFRLAVAGHRGKAIGRIVIPSIDVDVVMVEGDYEGTSETYLKVGPGHWPETPFPGQGGSFVVSGHRTTWGAPFFKLNELQPGDEIELVLPYAVVRYTVTRVFVVAPDDIEVVADQGKEQVSLVACHPIYSAKQRIIAQGDMSSFVLIEPEDRP